MTKIKNILVLLTFAVIIYACGDDNVFSNPYADVNYEALAVSDNDSIVKFLESHYYDTSLKSLEPLVDGETAMLNDAARLKTIDVTQNDINYKLYVFVTEVGVPDFTEDTTDDPTKRKDFPTKMDSVFVNRKGIELVNNNLDSSPFDQDDETWFSLGATLGLGGQAPSPIIGWIEGFQKLKSGENITNNGPLTFQNTGNGYFFIPSGLAYPSINYQIGQSQNPLFDKILVFKVELLDIVENTDHDFDGVASINEDADGDGDPTNDFSDSNNPTLPDYLNPSIN